MTTSPDNEKLQAMAKRGLVPADDAAKRLGVSLSTVYRLMDRKRLTGLVESSRWRWVSLKSIARFIRVNNGSPWTVVSKIAAGELFATKDGQTWLKTNEVIGHEEESVLSVCVALGSGKLSRIADETLALSLDPPVPPALDDDQPVVPRSPRKVKARGTRKRRS